MGGAMTPDKSAAVCFPATVGLVARSRFFLIDYQLKEHRCRRDSEIVTSILEEESCRVRAGTTPVANKLILTM